MINVAMQYHREHLFGRTQTLLAQLDCDDDASDERINRWIEDRLQADSQLFVVTLAAGGRWLVQSGQLAFVP